MSYSAQNLLDGDPFGFGRFVNAPEKKVVILWDYENCPVPDGISGLTAVHNIREAALKFGSIDQFEAYAYWSTNHSASVKSDLSLSGIKLRDCPFEGRKSSIDRTLTIDLMLAALDRPRATTTVLLIAADKAYAYAIATLRNRGYPVKVLAPPDKLWAGLKISLGDSVLSWGDVLGAGVKGAKEPLLDFGELAGEGAGLNGVAEESEEEETDEEEEEEEEEEDSEEEESEGEEEEEESEEEQHTEVVKVDIHTELEVVEETKQEAITEAPLDTTDFKSRPLPEPPVNVVLPTAPTPFQRLETVEDPESPTIPKPPYQRLDSPIPAPLSTPSQGEPSTASQYRSPSPQPYAKFTAPVDISSPFDVGPTWSPIQVPAALPRVQSPPVAQQTRPPNFPKFTPFSPPPQTQHAFQPAATGGTSRFSPFSPPSVTSQQPLPTSPYSQPLWSQSSAAQSLSALGSSGSGSSFPGTSSSLLDQPEPVEPGHNKRNIPAKYLHLVQVLDQIKNEGTRSPLWGTVCTRVYKVRPTVLKDAGVKKWKDYMALAQKEGIVRNNTNTAPAQETCTLLI